MGVIGSVAVPLVLLAAGYFIQERVADLGRTQAHSDKLIEVAASILAADPKSTASQPEIRNWAIQVFDRYSGIPLTKAAQQQLQTQPLILSSSSSRVEGLGEVQDALALLGYLQNFDWNLRGTSGPQTQQAVLEFQRANNMAPDGLVGPRTRAAILEKAKAAQEKPAP